MRREAAAPAASLAREAKDGYLTTGSYFACLF